MKSSTATGTTVTGREPAGPFRAGFAAAPRAPHSPPYRGRFAPSPNGPLHQGSLFAAVASWLDARARGGTWLIRMEDLDGPRTVPGAAAQILAELARFGLESDEPVLYQSGRASSYRATLDWLIACGLAYRCRCSRSEIQGPYDGRCRDLGITDPDSAWRLRLAPDNTITFEDSIQGHVEFAVASIGDPVLVRRDGLAAYQLAVVVDDLFQGVTDVVRGADLLESTAWQIALLRALQAPIPRYTHVPVLTEPDGQKLAKSRRSLAIAAMEPAPTLALMLELLGLPPNPDLKAATVSDMLHWAVQHWRPQAMSGIRVLPCPVNHNSHEVRDERVEDHQEVPQPSSL